MTITGQAPFRLAYDGYDRALAFWQFDRLPQYREPLLRALARGICEWLFPMNPPKGT